MRHRTWDFDIDRFLNPFIPPPPWKYLPYPLAHFLGYRRTRRRPSGNLMPVFWAFIGIFSTILLIEAVSYQIPSFRARRVPTIVGSFVRLQHPLGTRSWADGRLLIGLCICR